MGPKNKKPTIHFRGLRPTATLKHRAYGVDCLAAANFRGLRPTATLKLVNRNLVEADRYDFRGLRPTATLKRPVVGAVAVPAGVFPWASAHGHIEASGVYSTLPAPLHFRGLRPTATLKRVAMRPESLEDIDFRGLRPTATLKQPARVLAVVLDYISVGFGPRPH